MTNKEKELIKELYSMSKNYNWHDLTSMRFALDEIKNFIQKHFLSDERSDEWKIEQFNRNRAPEDQVSTIKEMKERVNEIFNS